MKPLNEDYEIIKTKGWVYYVKWASSIILIFAVACRAIEEIPKIYDVVLSLIGTTGWLIVGLNWRDRAITLLNTVVLFMLILSFLRYIVTH